MDNLYYKVKTYLEENSKTVSEFDSNIMLNDDGDGNPYIGTWNVTGLAKPSDDQLNALASTATTSLNNHRTRRNRKRAYGNWRDQLDEIYHNIDDWKAKIKAVKEKFPKENN